MLRLSCPRSSRPTRLLYGAGMALLLAAALASPALGQNSASAPASIPAGAVPPKPAAPPAKAASAAVPAAIPASQLRQADNAYLEGARQLERKDLAAAQHSFARAVELNPRNRDYTLALLVTRENHVTQLVQNAAEARRAGDNTRADALLEQARAIDPDDPVVAQHFGTKPLPSPRNDLQIEAQNTTFDPSRFPAQDIASTLGGPTEFAPLPGVKSFHLRGDASTLLRSVYSAFGIQATFDPSVSGGRQLKLDLDNVDFAGASRVLGDLTDDFAVAVQPRTALIAKNTQENRDKLVPLVEETVYLPGVSSQEMSELANVARTVFDIRQVTASATGGDILLRGNEKSLQLLNATYADLLSGSSDVLFDINLYELDKTHIRNIGAELPASASLFSITQEAQNLVNANQSTINAVIATGDITLTGNATENTLLEALYLIKYAGITDANLTNLLATVGSLDGIPLAGLSVSGTSTFNLLLSATDVRMLDSVQLRSGSGQDATFKAGSRYPIITSTYSSGISSTLASSLSGLNINGTSVSSLLSQYLGTSSVTVPQFQYEDLGITLKMTPHVLHGSEVALKLDMKIEALGGSSIDSIPILNNRSLTSTITIPAGHTAMLATLVNTNELGSIDGLPGLSELPGFQGTDKDIEHDSDELLLTITPHVVRQTPLRVASRRLAMPHITTAEQ